MMVNISNLQGFLRAKPVESLIRLYEDKYLPLSRAALLKIYNDVGNYNGELGYFNLIQGRIKSKNSLFNKIFLDIKRRNEGKVQVSEDIVEETYKNVKDVVGLRAVCQYMSEIKALADIVFFNFLPKEHNYIDLQQMEGAKFEPKDYVKNPDDSGYRGFHLYLGIPTEIDIYGRETEIVTCEIQIKTELQHIWSSRSHDLIFKPRGVEISCNDRGSMKRIGGFLDGADWFLEDIKNRVV
jgi:ppGpp synthetase/RelA/SpoT-type nucleotidyltranferase